ncbi:MAG: YhdH/YhfP family quinone oxidoreductase [Actinomycetaceae bacterium]|nr:YhdH/YhfP family quinone oxidoreductase [Actinomycetaceae bacterium]
MDTAAAFQLIDTDAGVRGRHTRIRMDELGEGDMLIRVTHSSINYKDGLAATGRAPIARTLPLVGGCCAAGVVVQPGESGLEPGTVVSVVGATLSEQHNGGYCEYLRVPSAWAMPVPEPFTAWEAGAIGTAGVTAAIALIKLEDAGCLPGSGPVAVTGASGGSGSIAVALLAARGYEVTALTGKPEAADFLRELGAAHIEPRPDTSSTRPLEKGRWAGAIDTVGGPTLAWLIRTTRPGGAIAAFGNAGGNRLDTTVLPFILRGVSLLGVTVTFPAPALRTRVWQLLAESLSPRALRSIASEISFEELDGALERIVTTGITGRIVVRIGEE